MNQKISIIVPVFNAESSLHRMMDSLLKQTFDVFEVLLIDDGSTDSSGCICDQYAEQHEHIRVIHKSNGGVSAARQTGIEAAQGEYVIHADSDDWVEPTMLEELYKKAKEDDADVVICDFYLNKGNEQTYWKQKPSACTPDAVLRDLFQQLHGSCCNKLVRRAYYSRYDIRFPEGINYCEDLLFWVQLFQHPEVKIIYLPKAFYHYWTNGESITHHYTRATYRMRQKYQEKLEELLPRKGYEHEIQHSAFSVFTEAFINDILSKSEIEIGLRDFRVQIQELKSLKWKAGFFLLHHRCPWIAHKLIHF